MIKKENEYFIIETKSLSYIFSVNKAGYLVNDYFGDKIEVKDYSSLGLKEAFSKGTSVIADTEKAPDFSQDNALMEYSVSQKGDFKEPALIISDNSRGYTFDFKYLDYKISNEVSELNNLPNLHSIKEELIVVLKDVALDIYLELHYLVNDEFDVIVRNTVIVNKTGEELKIEKIASLQLDMINNNYSLLNLTGSWIGETHKVVQKIFPGIYINDSKTGNSSAKHNPFFMILGSNTTEDYGTAFSFNLMYSSNHQELVELTVYDHIHITCGINPYMFNWQLKPGEKFETPYALLSYSGSGTNLISRRMHDFINHCVVNPNF